MQKAKKIGFALSGGGARGLAHIGVYKSLLENEIKPDIVAGTSMGAIIGSLIAAGFSPEELVDIANDRTSGKLFQPHLPKLGISSTSPVKKILEELLPDKIEDLKTPLFISTTNLTTGQNVMWSEGNLVEVVMASICIPVAFDPVEIRSELYVDGGLTKNLPAFAIRERCEFLIGSHVNYLDEAAKLKSVPEIMERCFRIAIYNTVRSDKDLCDFFVNPPEVREFGTLNFKNVNRIIDIGYKACIDQLNRAKIF